MTTHMHLTDVQKTNRLPERFVRAAVPYDNQRRQTVLSHVWRIGIPKIFPTWSLLAVYVDKEANVYLISLDAMQEEVCDVSTDTRCV